MVVLGVADTDIFRNTILSLSAEYLALSKLKITQHSSSLVKDNRAKYIHPTAPNLVTI